MLRFIALLLAMLPVISFASGDVDQIKKSLQALVPGIEPDSIEAAPVKGLYEVVFGTRVFYVSADGRYLLRGDIMDTATRDSITETRQSALRAALINSVDESGMIVFSPEKPKYTVTVFTDIDCGYCRKLHREIQSYNDAGIAVRYMAFPRSGPNTESYFKAISVWCGKDRKALMTQAKNGESLEQAKCDNPIDKHMEVANQIGISGTPTIILEDGTLMPGYVPALRLLEALDQHAS